MTTKRFQLCQLPNHGVEGAFHPDSEWLTGADFDSKEEALQFVGVFPGEGHGYVWDRVEARAVHLVSWVRKVRGN